VSRSEARTDLVLVGGGHAHVQVLRRWMMAPLPDVRLSVVLDRPVAVYSGMVPGFVSGEYEAEELEIDVVPLARRAGARVILAAAVDIDPVARRIAFEDRPTLGYDVASLDVGSTVRGLDLPGVREHAFATRPICDFVDRLESRVEVLRAGETRVVVVGAGAAGVELCFTLDARLRSQGIAAQITLLDASHRVLAGLPARVSRRLSRELAHRGISLRGGARVREVRKGRVVLEDDELSAELVVWATGAAPHASFRTEALPRDASGFVRVRPTLQVVGQDDLFAVGDCAALEWAPWVRKAGVYAVREGPVLDANLRARLRGGRLRSYSPQRDFLMLLNLGGARALGTKWGVTAAGSRVWRLKDWIDRRFMRRFRVLDAEGAPASDFPSAESMGMEEMACGGCAAKVGQSALSRALERLPPAQSDTSVLRGLDQPDDVAALRLPRGDVLLATVDAFRAFTDDPWLVGRVAAVNAASDVLAKGGTPRHALALVTVPEEEGDRTEEALYQVLAGVRAALDPLGVTLVGGHTTQGQELFVGLAITGDPPASESILGLDGARPRDALILTKPLGTGVLLAADMQGLLPGPLVTATHTALLRDNAAAARVALACGARACTDVSGFGLAGHLAELLRASGVSARVDLGTLPALDGALAVLSRGVRSTFHDQNAEARRGLALPPAAAASPALPLLFDPQTSGGLLMSVPEERALEAVAALRAGGDGRAAVIGKVTPPRTDGAAFEVRLDGPGRPGEAIPGGARTEREASREPSA
jgi:selenide,water dikinase